MLGILSGLFDHYMDNPEELGDEYAVIAKEDGLKRAVCDYVAGMSDEYAVRKFKDLYIPSEWSVN